MYTIWKLIEVPLTLKGNSTQRRHSEERKDFLFNIHLLSKIEDNAKNETKQSWF